MVERCFTDGTKTYLHPILEWSEEEVWQYIHENNIPYCTLYNEGFSRLGCVMCPYKGKKGRLLDAFRWPKYYQAYLRAFGEMLRCRLRDGLETQWTDAEDVMHWWIYGRDNNVVEGQISLFSEGGEE